MAAAPFLIAGGAALSAYGAIKSNMDQSDAERANADYYREQGDYAKLIGEREEQVYSRQANFALAETRAAYAKGGVEMSGSPLLMMEQGVITREREVRAIRLESAKRARLAYMRADFSEQNADRLGGFTHNFLTAGGTILSGAGSTYAAASRD